MCFFDIFFRKKVKEKSNSITAENVGGNIYQGNTINIVDPATGVLAASTTPANMSVTMDSVAQAIKKTDLLPKGYGEKIVIENGQATISTVVTDEQAASEHPQRIKGKMEIKDCSTAEDFAKEFQRAYISQTPIDVNMLEMKKMLGDIEDPFQDKFQREVENSSFRILPPELPKAWRCEFGIENTACCYDNIWLRLKPVNPDDHICVISNDESCDELKLTLTYSFDTGSTTINHSFNQTGWPSIKKYLEFMKAANVGAELYIRVIEADTELFRVKLTEPLYGSEYDQLDNDICFVRDVMIVEAYFNVSFDPQLEFDDEEYKMIHFLSKSIRGIPESFTWEKFSCSGVGRLQDGVEPFKNPNEFSICYDYLADVTIQGRVLEKIRIKTKFETARYEDGSDVVDYSDGSRIDVKLVPASSNKGSRIAALD